MIGLSWRLWSGTSRVPRVPFVAGMPALPGFLNEALAAALVGTILLAGWRRKWVGWFGASVGLAVWMAANDQERFQPWIYQYAMTGLMFAVLGEREGLKYARWWFAAVYFHSGMSKLDVSFCDELGPVFLKAAMTPFGVDVGAWPFWEQTLAALAMPAWEVVVAVTLVVPKARRWGRLGAVMIHLGLMGILGPLGLGHSAIVILWNAAMAAEVWLLFGKEIAYKVEKWNWLRSVVKGVFWAGVLLPIGERWGVFDAWPSHALYASHVERVSVLLHESELALYPETVRSHLREAEGPWRLLDLNGWSRAERGTPVYPGNRASAGLAEGLAARYGGRLVRVIAFGPADRWTGQRRRVDVIGREAIGRLGEGFRFNARPTLDSPPGAAGNGLQGSIELSPRG